MVIAGKKGRRLVIADDPEKFEQQYQESLKVILRLINPKYAWRAKRSIRYYAKKWGVSHVTLLNLRDHPTWTASRKTKMKIIRAINPAPPRKKKKVFVAMTGRYYANLL